jgi:class 3 adenylate cyclase
LGECEVALKEDLQEAVKKIFREQWTQRHGEVVPEPKDLGLGNDASNFKATVLYADIEGSTGLVDSQKAHLAAEVYKTYMVCAARIIKSNGGTITAYDGDRIMGIFIGKSKNTIAARTALQINWAVSNIVNAGLKTQYGDGAYQVKHVVGVDTSSIFACRIGVRNDNDIVWVGRAANYAAKLVAINEYPVYITGEVFDSLDDGSKFGGNPRQLMWEERAWTSMNKMRIFRSNWTWGI